MINKIKESFADISPESQLGKIGQKMVRENQEILDRFVAGIRAASENAAYTENTTDEGGVLYDLRELENETHGEKVARLRTAKVEYVTADPKRLSKVSKIDVSNVKAQTAADMLFPVFEKFGVFGKHYNETLDIEFDYSRTAGKRSFSHQIGISGMDYSAQAIVQANLKQLCEGAYPVEAHTDEKPTSDNAKIRRVITLYNAIQAGQDAIFVKMTVKIPENESNRLHMVVASKIEKGLDLALIADATKSQSADKSNPTITIAQILDYVKDIDEFTKRIPVSEVLDDVKFDSRDSDLFPDDDLFFSEYDDISYVIKRQYITHSEAIGEVLKTQRVLLL